MPDYPYMTLYASTLANAERHEERARMWEAAGRPDYAAGSRRKAERNRQRAALMEGIVWRSLSEGIEASLFGGNHTVENANASMDGFHLRPGDSVLIDGVPHVVGTPE